MIRGISWGIFICHQDGSLATRPGEVCCVAPKPHLLLITGGLRDYFLPPTVISTPSCIGYIACCKLSLQRWLLRPLLSALTRKTIILSLCLPVLVPAPTLLVTKTTIPSARTADYLSLDLPIEFLPEALQSGPACKPTAPLLYSVCSPLPLGGGDLIHSVNKIL